MTNLLQKRMEQKLVEFKYVNRNYMKIACGDRKFLEQLYAYFSVFVKNYKHMPKYKSGVWDGKIKYFDKLRSTLPLGLLQEANRYITKFYKDKRIIVDPMLKKLLFNKNYPEIVPEDFTLDRKPWKHQILSIKKGIYNKRAVIKNPTASGKSYTITCTMNFLYEKGEVTNWLLIVPTIQLVEQFKKDMIEYGIPEEMVGIIHGGVHQKTEEFAKTYVISTWQSLAQKLPAKGLKWKDVLEKYEGIIVDEVHLANAKELKNILLHCESSIYRLGYTGTLPDRASDLYGVLSFVGPKVLDILTKNLIAEGIISDLKIRTIHIKYENKSDYSDMEWHEVKQKIINEPKRLDLISKICGSSKKNFLLLVSYVETEGKILEKYLKQKFPKRQVVFVHGAVPVHKREDIRTSAEFRDDMIIIATYGTFKMGINIKNLHRIILASPLKSKISNLQSIGRGLRVLPGKKLIVYDLVDRVRYLWSHGKKRAHLWKQEDFNVKSYLMG
jgi:superfamily II DNA or RNA helicase